jgi:hypothetical protein
MTESDWATCREPQLMLAFVRERGRASDRKLRLFACACCRRIWQLLPDEPCRRAVELSEQYADGWGARRDLAKAGRAACLSRSPESAQAVDAAASTTSHKAFTAAEHAALTSPAARAAPLYRAGPASYSRWGEMLQAETQRLPALLRCIFGNPLSPAVVEPGWMTAEAVALTQAAYDERHLPSGHLDPQRLAVLADALEEAGCAEAELLGHLRGEGPHWRGCWAVDLILGKG